jgi:hypothetical protein
MSLASELLFNSLGRSSQGGAEDQNPSTEDTLGRWCNLNHIVYALIGDHEPDPQVAARLRADLKVMQLSGLISEYSPAPRGEVYRNASQVMDQLMRLLPRVRE